jgi:hypothetical protein
VLVVFMHPEFTDGDAVADALLESLGKRIGPAAVVWLGGDEERFRARLRRAGITVADSPEAGAVALLLRLGESP